MFGLSAGLACTVIILLYVQSETSYDQYHTDKDRIYRLGSKFRVGENYSEVAVSSVYLAPLLQSYFPGIESTFRLHRIPKIKATYGEENHYLEKLFWGDSTAFDFFTAEFIFGHPDSSLRHPNEIVLSESYAKLFFGNRNPIGDTILTSNRFKYCVTGVFKDLPEETHHRFNGLLSYSTLDKVRQTTDSTTIRSGLWLMSDFTFIKLKEDYPVDSFLADFPDFYRVEMEEIGLESNSSYFPIAEPLPSIHLNSNLEFEAFTPGNYGYLYSFSLVGLFILLLAGINYVNMATARAATREREVGLRKVLGTRKGNLILQFLGESIFLSTVALLLAFAIVEMILSLTRFNELMDKDLALNLLEQPTLLLSSLAIALILGILSGLYPAFFLSSILPARALRRRTTKGGSVTLRKTLVILQFSISIAVIICTLIMANQVEFMRTRDLGFANENVAVVAVRDTMSQQNLPELRANIEALPGVIATTTAYGVPAHNIARRLFKLEKKGGQKVEELIDFIRIGFDYVEGMGLEIVDGRDLLPGNPIDSSSSVLISETAAREFFDGEAVGSFVQWGIDKDPDGQHDAIVVGVFRDFRVASLHQSMRPLILIPQQVDGGMLHIRMEDTDVPGTLAEIERLWAPSEARGSTFNPFFIDDKFDQLYAADQRQSQLMGLLAVICVVISILGLFGFASYTVAIRRREIGVRKVLGASTWRIVRMFLGEVIFLVGVAGLIAALLAYLSMQWWLQAYSVQAPLRISTFFTATGIALLTAAITVSAQTLRAALANPVQVLKYE